MERASHPPYVFRVSRGNPWLIRAPRGHNRFDIFDPEESIMTLYTGESKEAAFAEVLAPFRPDLESIAKIKDIPCDDDKTPSFGKVPKAWLSERRIGKAKIRAKAHIIDIASPITMQALRSNEEIARYTLKAGFKDLDDSALKASDEKGRYLTQMIAAFIYNLGHTGIRYESRLGSLYKCVAGFVPLSVSNAADSDFLEQTMPEESISARDPELQNVASIFNLKLPYVVI